MSQEDIIETARGVFFGGPVGTTRCQGSVTVVVFLFSFSYSHKKYNEVTFEMFNSVGTMKGQRIIRVVVVVVFSFKGLIVHNFATFLASSP